MRNSGLIACSLFLVSGVAVAAPQTPATPGTPVFKKPDAPVTGPPIKVSVNGQPIQFSTGQAVEIKGRVFVPMRGVFEKLGASVDFDPATQMIKATRGTTTIQLRPGDQSAQVNGEMRPLDAPAQIMGGATVVPLRFVSETLGAQVKWDRDAMAVEVTTDAIVAGKLPTVPGNKPVFGAVTGVFPESNELTVRVAGGTNVRVPLAADVSATRRTYGTGASESQATSETHPVFTAGTVNVGDQVMIERDASGNGTVVSINTDIRRGTIKSIQPLPTNGGHQITLTDGSVVRLRPGAPITFGDRRVPLNSLKSAEKVAIRLDSSGEGIAMAVITPADPNVIPAYPAPSE